MSVGVSCVSRASELVPGQSRVIVLPEYVEATELERVVTQNHKAIVVGAVLERNRCRAVLRQGGANLLDYLKADTDGTGWTKGVGHPPVDLPVFETESICVSVVICTDTQRTDVQNPVIEKLRSSRAKHKLFCIPAYMGPEWFSTPGPYPQYEGITVILCNHTDREARRKSFVMDACGQMIAAQTDREAIHVDIE